MGNPGIPQKLIKKINVNGLSGRMMQLPSPKKNSQNMLLIYGIGSSLERIYPLALSLNKRVSVMAPDLPGFGGMDSMYKIGMRPTLDNLTDYVATIIKLHYRKQRFVIGGLDYGFAIVTNLLKNYPEISERVDLVVSFAGLNDWHELQMHKRKLYSHRALGTVLTKQLPSGLASGIALLLRPRLKLLIPDLRTYLQARQDLLHLKCGDVTLPQTVHYFPGTDCYPANQTTVVKDLKKIFKKLHVVTDFELACAKDDITITRTRTRASLRWLGK